MVTKRICPLFAERARLAELKAWFMVPTVRVEAMDELAKEIEEITGKAVPGIS